MSKITLPVEFMVYFELTSCEATIAINAKTNFVIFIFEYFFGWQIIFRHFFFYLDKLSIIKLQI